MVGGFYQEKTYLINRGNKSIGTTITITVTEGITLPIAVPNSIYYNPNIRKRTPYASFAGQSKPNI